MSEPMTFCPRCEAEITMKALHANEGHCADCCAALQAELDSHNAEIDAWDRMTDEQKDAAIRRAGL